jgi:hypothetical protein
MNARPNILRRLRNIGPLLIVAGALAVAGFAPPTASAYASDAYLSCPQMMGYSIQLPGSTSTRMSRFHISLDYGSWQKTSWYYTDGWNYWEWMGRSWRQMGYGETVLTGAFADQQYHHVRVWEERAYSSSNGWYDMGSCWASNSYGFSGGGGLVFN